MELRRNGIVMFLLLYKLTMDVVYVRYVWGMRYGSGSGWGYCPYNVNLSMDIYILSWLACAVILWLFAPTFQKTLDKYRFSEWILFLLLLLSVIPGMAMCGAGAFPVEYMWAFYLYWGLFFGFVRWGFTKDFNASAIKARLSSTAKVEFLAYFGAFVAVFVIAIFFYFTGGQVFFNSLLSAEIYEVRAKFEAVSLPIFLDYIMANAILILLFLLLFCLWKGKTGLAIFIMLIGYMKFSCGANKIDVFSLFVGMAVYAGRKYLTVKRIVFLAIVIAITAGILIDFWSNYHAMIFLVRQMFATNLISSFYYDFFQYHTPFLYSFFDGPMLDRRAVTFMIGELYMGEPTNMANNGLLGDAFQMLGDYGVVFGPICWLAWLCLLDMMGNGCPWWIKLGTSVYWVTIMQNGSFITSMLSHGGLAMVMLAYLCSEGKANKDLSKII